MITRRSTRECFNNKSSSDHYFQCLSRHVCQALLSFVVHTAQKFINAHASSALTKVSSLYLITMIMILICLQRINALRATVQVTLEDSKHKDKKEDNKEDIDNRPSNKPCNYKPCDNNSNNKGTTLSSRLNAK